MQIIGRLTASKPGKCDFFLVFQHFQLGAGGVWVSHPIVYITLASFRKYFRLQWIKPRWGTTDKSLCIQSLPSKYRSTSIECVCGITSLWEIFRISPRSWKESDCPNCVPCSPWDVLNKCLNERPLCMSGTVLGRGNTKSKKKDKALPSRSSQ